MTGAFRIVSDRLCQVGANGGDGFLETRQASSLKPGSAAVREEQDGVVRARVAFHADAVEGTVDGSASDGRQIAVRNGRV